MQFSNSEIRSALHQNGGDLPKTLRFLSLYREELAGVKKEGSQTEWSFSNGVIPPDFAKTWESFHTVPFLKDFLKVYVGNGAVISVDPLKKDFETDNLDEILEKIRLHYLKHLTTGVKIGDFLGEGAYGEVYLASGPDIQYVVKKFGDDKKKSYERETKIL